MIWITGSHGRPKSGGRLPNGSGKSFMDTIPLPQDSKELLKLFNSHGVDYLLVGGYAVIHYGYVRSTGDMDVWIAVSASNAKRVSAALQDFGFSAAEVMPDLFMEEGRMTRMGNVPFRIEILTKISGLTFAKAFARRSRVLIDDVEVNVIGLRDLLVNKRASGRHKDLADIENLPQIAKRKVRRRKPPTQ